MLAAPFETCQELATPTRFRPRGGPQRIAPHARSRGLSAGHLALMARLEIGAPRCSPPFTSGVLGARRRAVRRRGTPSDLHGMGKSDPWADGNVGDGSETRRRALRPQGRRLEPGVAGRAAIQEVATRSSTRTGRRRTRLPVAAKIALHTAGAMTGTPGSPTPVGG